jgi:ferredoxin
MKIIVDMAHCCGHARCATIDARLFELNEDGYIAFAEKAVPPGMEGLAQRGVRACPERILTLAGDGSP